MFDISWTCKHTWQKASYNTMWCLIGCSIGDFGTIYYFQIIDHSLSIYVVMLLAIINGLITSIILETIILMKTFIFADAISIAFKMSFISMLSMEIAMNLTDYLLTGGAILTWWVIPIMLTVGFLTPWPYNYWRLKKFNEACH